MRVLSLDPISSYFTAKLSYIGNYQSYLILLVAESFPLFGLRFGISVIGTNVRYFNCTERYS